MSAGNLNDFAIDSFDPAVISQNIGFFRSLFRAHDVGIDGVIPCIVKSYDPKAGTVSAQPIVKCVVPHVSGEKEVDRPVYEDIPVMGLCHGGFEVSFPLFIGDTGLLVALDRSCNDAIKRNSSRLESDQSEDSAKNEGPASIDDKSLASFEHSVFIPFSFSGDKSKNGVLTIKKLGEDGPKIELKDKSATVECGASVVKVGIDDITIKRGSDSLTFSDQGIFYVGKIDKQLELLTGIKYDLATHSIYKKSIDARKRGDLIVQTGNESDWTVIENGEAVPLPVQQ